MLLMSNNSKNIIKLFQLKSLKKDSETSKVSQAALEACSSSVWCPFHSRVAFLSGNPMHFWMD
jgi:hypothetical protein